MFCFTARTSNQNNAMQTASSNEEQFRFFLNYLRHVDVITIIIIIAVFLVVFASFVLGRFSNADSMQICYR